MSAMEVPVSKSYSSDEKTDSPSSFKATMRH